MDIQEDLVDNTVPSNDIIGLRVLTRPRPVDRLQALILALSSEPDLKKVLGSRLVPHLAGSLLYGGKGFDLEFLRKVGEETLRYRTCGANISARTWPTININGGAAWDFLPTSAKGQTMGIIGNGPAAVLMARIRTELGYPASSTVIYGERENGLWAQPNVVGEGHNTFSDLDYFGVKMDRRNGYHGAVLVDFLNGLRRDSGVEVRSGMVWSLSVEPSSGRYSIYDRIGTKLGEHDAILIATGAPEPRPLGLNAPMQTNVETSKLVFKRWQHVIPKDDWVNFRGAKPLLIGLGNSTLAMLRQFDLMRQDGIDVQPTVLTHLDPRVVSGFGERRLFPLRGREEAEIFTRHPSRLTALSLDIPDHNRTFNINLGKIITGVSSWEIALIGKDDVSVTVFYQNKRKGITASKAHLYALIGYQVRRPLMERLGVQVNANGEVIFDPRTSVVGSTFSGHPNRIYVAGAAANTIEDPNRSVIPGMTTNLCDIAFVEVIKGLTKCPK